MSRTQAFVTTSDLVVRDGWKRDIVDTVRTSSVLLILCIEPFERSAFWQVTIRAHPIPRSNRCRFELEQREQVPTPA